MITPDQVDATRLVGEAAEIAHHEAAIDGMLRHYGNGRGEYTRPILSETVRQTIIAMYERGGWEVTLTIGNTLRFSRRSASSRPGPSTER